MHHEYRGIYPKEWIDLLRTLEARYNSRRASCEDQKPAAKNKKGDQPDGDDYNIESSPRVPHKKCRPNPGRVNNIITLATAAPITTVSLAKR